MSYLDLYRKRVTLNGSTSQEQVINESKIFFNDYIQNNPNKFTIQLNNIGEEYDVTIQDVSFSKSDDDKILLTYFDVPLNTGDYFLWNNKNWLIVLLEEPTINSYKKARIRKSNHTLKFYLSDGTTLITTPAIVTNRVSTGTDEDRYLILPEGKFEVTIQDNDNNKTIKKGTRFIINDEAWKTSFVDKTTIPGLIKLTVEADVLKDSDDLVNGIADNSVPDSGEGGDDLW